MKKVIVLLAAAAMAVASQAASVTWKTGTGVKAPGEGGTFSTTTAGAGTIGLYVWILDKGTFDGLTMDTVVSTYKDALGTATGNATGKSGSTGATVVTTHDDWSTESATTYYAAVLTTYTKDGTTQYIGNLATAQVNTSGTGGTVNNLAKFVGGGTSGTAITGYSTGGNVPEPTSGLLLLVGGALLALRRKQK